MELITLNILTKAIENKTGIEKKQAKKEAEKIMDFFGFQDRIVDNILQPKERQLFYELEKAGLLTSEREVLYLHNGRLWRIHYWIIKKDTIIKYSKLTRTKKTDTIIDNKNIESIYDSLNESMWQARTT